MMVPFRKPTTGPVQVRLSNIPHTHDNTMSYDLRVSEIDGFYANLSQAVWMPPGRRVDNPWTFIPAGMFGAVLKLGLKGIKVSI